MTEGTLGYDVYLRRVTRRKIQTPGTAEEHKRQETPTINPNDHQPAQLTDQAAGTIERAAQAASTIRHHYPHSTGSSSDPVSQRSPQHRRAELHYNTDTIRLSGDTQRPPPGGGHYQEWLMSIHEGGGARAEASEWGG